MGRTSQPNNIRTLKGERNKGRYLPDGIPVDSVHELPNPPQWWEDKTVEFYEEKGVLLLAHKLLTPLDIDYFFKFCWLAVKIDRLCEAGETPAMSMYTQHDKYSANLGLSRIGREKIKAPPSKASNKYSKKNPNMKKKLGEQ